MDYVIFDIEWNPVFIKEDNSYFNEIIEIGAVKTNGSLKIVDRFSECIKLSVGKNLVPHIKNITGISDETLKSSKPFNEVFEDFKRFSENSILASWGICDILVLIKNVKFYFGSDRIEFLNEYIDIQNYCEKALKYTEHTQLALSSALSILNIKEEKFEHRAFYDSLSALKCFKALFNGKLSKDITKNANSDNFYSQLCSKTSFVCNIKNPLIDKTKMWFICNKCHKKAKRISKWKRNNKSYIAVFHCRNCNNEFTGKIKFKLKYGEVTIDKKILPNEGIF